MRPASLLQSSMNVLRVIVLWRMHAFYEGYVKHTFCRTAPMNLMWAATTKAGPQGESRMVWLANKLNRSGGVNT